MYISRFSAIVGALFFSLAGCTHQHKQSDFVSQSLQEVVAPQSRQATRAPVRSSPVQTIHPAGRSNHSPIGIIVDHDRIIIDTNQTRHFFESLSRKLDRGFKKIEQDLKKDQLQSPNDTGIIVSQDHIEIDLNKTEVFMGKWIKSMQRVGQELDNVFQELDRSLDP